MSSSIHTVDENPRYLYTRLEAVRYPQKVQQNLF
jgi:hypothetical protein